MSAEPVPADFEESFIDTEGIETHYWARGPEDGEPLVMVHGGGSGADSWGNWKFAMPRLADLGFRTYAMDMVGFGQSATPDPDEFDYTNQKRIEQLAGFIEALGLDRPSLVGNSMGGAASMGVAMQSPEIIEKLILVGGAGHLQPEDRPQGSQDAIEVLSGFDGSKEAMFDVVDVLSVTEWYDREAMVDHRLENYDRPGVQAAFRETMKIATGGDLYYDDEEIAAIPHETLIINGREDLVIPPRGAWGMFDLIDKSSVHILPNCGHWVMVDQVDWATSLVANFFDYGG